MNITCYRIAEDAHLAAMPAEAFVEPWKKGEGRFWIDINAFCFTNFGHSHASPLR